MEHSYPHSWRSQVRPFIFRNTPQWFIRIDEVLKADADGATLRETGAEGHRRHQPSTRRRGKQPHPFDGRGATRLADQPPARLGHAAGHVRGSSHTGQPLHDPDVDARIVAAIEAGGGADAWFTLRRTAEFLGACTIRPNVTRRSTDILDVWFDSGCDPRLHPRAARSGRERLCRRPAKPTGRRTSIWRARTSIAAGSSRTLLEGCGTRGRAPVQALILTHGFTQDENGEKHVEVQGQHRGPG